jgi:hypothetical protein
MRPAREVLSERKPRSGWVESLSGGLILIRMHQHQRNPLKSVEAGERAALLLLRLDSKLLGSMKQVAERDGVSRSELVRGAFIAMKDDVFDRRRKRQLAQLRTTAEAISDSSAGTRCVLRRAFASSGPEGGLDRLQSQTLRDDRVRPKGSARSRIHPPDHPTLSACPHGFALHHPEPRRPLLPPRRVGRSREVEPSVIHQAPPESGLLRTELGGWAS